MVENIYTSVRNGYMRLKRFASTLYERIRVEIVVLKILHDIHMIDEKIEEHYKMIGRRVKELGDIHEKDILRDELIVESFKEIQRLSEEREDLIKKSSELAGDMSFLKGNE